MDDKYHIHGRHTKETSFTSVVVYAVRYYDQQSFSFDQVIFHDCEIGMIVEVQPITLFISFVCQLHFCFQLLATSTNTNR